MTVSRVGLVGAGAIAQFATLPSLTANPTVTIAGLVTNDPAETREQCNRWPIAQGYDSVQAMIEHADLDALMVLTPKHLHTPYVVSGLEAGLDVFCEKPLTTSLQEAEQIAELAENRNAVMMVGFNRRFAETYQRARFVLEKHPPEFVAAQKHRVGTEYRATLENGIHLLDLLRWFCGEATRVTAVYRGEDPYFEQGVTALIEFDTGIVASVLMVRCAGEWDERIEFYGADTTVRVVAPESISITHDGVSRHYESRTRANGLNDVRITAGFRPAIDHFLECVRTRRPPLTDAREAVKSQCLMERVLASAGLPLDDTQLIIS